MRVNQSAVNTGTVTAVGNQPLALSQRTLVTTPNAVRNQSVEKVKFYYFVFEDKPILRNFYGLNNSNFISDLQKQFNSLSVINYIYSSQIPFVVYGIENKFWITKVIV